MRHWSRTKTWKIYALEFLSIFVAVVSAFALNNWNDNRRSSHAENKILAEIHHGLDKDLQDIRLNKMGYEMGINSVGYFKRLLGNDTVAHDSAVFHYFNLTRDFISIQNTSGYETLKSKGLELIQNDSLRTSIISLYEYDYNTLRKLEEEYHEMQFHENYFEEMNELLAPYFIYNGKNALRAIARPRDLESEDRKLLLSFLWKIDVNRKFILGYYAEMETKIEHVKNLIDQEIDLP